MSFRIPLARQRAAEARPILPELHARGVDGAWTIATNELHLLEVARCLEIDFARRVFRREGDGTVELAGKLVLVARCGYRYDFGGGWIE